MIRLFLSLCLLSFSTVYGQNALIPYIQNGKWGYCDKDMKIVIPCKYDQAFPFFEERALVQFYDTIEPFAKSFFIDPKGDVVIRLNSASPGCPASRFHKGVALVENYNIPNYGENTNLTVIDREGNIIHQVDATSMDMELSMLREYSEAFNSEGIYSATVFTENDSKTVLIYNDQRKPLILNYPYVAPFNAGYAVAQEAYVEEGYVEEGWRTALRGKGWWRLSASKEPGLALINTRGEAIIPLGRYKLVMDYTKASKPELLFPFEKDGKQGYLNEKGDVIIEPKFDLVQLFSEGRAVVGKIVGYDEYEMPKYRYGYIDTKGNLQIPYLYEQAFAFSEDLAEVAVNDTIMFIDKNGKTALSFKTNISIDIYGIPGIYQTYYYDHGFKDGTAILFIDDKIGFINKKGEFIIEPLYNGLSRVGPSLVLNQFENGIVKVNPATSLGYYEYFIDKSGRAYMQPQALLMRAHDGIICRYSAPTKSSYADTLVAYDCPEISRYTGKKDKIKGKKGEWIEIDYWGQKSYVFSADFITTSVLTTDIKGAELYESKDTKKIFEKIPAGSILFPAPGEKISKIGSDQLLKVLHFTTSTETETGFVTKTLWIKANKVKLLNK